MEKLADLLKIFADKHLIPSAASLAFAISGVAFLPDAFGISKNVGKFLYGVLIFCLCFLLIQFGKYLAKTVKNAKSQKDKKTAEEQEKKRKEEINEKKSLEDLWQYVDTLSPQDKDFLREFLKNENQPIELVGGEPFNGLLSNKKFVVSTEKPTGQRRKNTMKFEGRQVYYTESTDYSTTRLYKLNDEFYKLLKYSYEKYKRISHFDMEEENDG